MLIPVRCFTCNKVIAQLWKRYCELLAAGEPEHLALDRVGLKRYCCRRMFISHYDAYARMDKYEISFEQPRKRCRVE
jgi:DNA-directed RNA polymerases I, II, and III subunit RPABC5